MSTPTDTPDTNVFASLASFASHQSAVHAEEVQAIKLEVEKAEEHARAIVISTDEDATRAGEFLKQLKDIVRANETKRKKTVKPFNDGVKAINDEFKANSAPFEQAIADLNVKILSYKQKRDAEQAEAQRLVEEQRQQAAQQSFVTGLPPAVIPDAPTASEVLKSSGVGTRKIWKAEVIDLSKVPLNYIEINMPELNRAKAELVAQFNAGDLSREALEQMIPGVRIYQEEGLVS